MANPIFSVCVATVPARTQTSFPVLLNEILRQAEPYGATVEVLWFGDNLTRSVGAKRNGLLALSRGEFLAFVDDDDEIADDYVTEVMTGIAANPNADVICFLQECTINGGQKHVCRYGVEYDYVWDGGEEWFGKPAHTMIWRGAIGRKHKFPEKNFGEDSDWAKRCSAEVREQGRIEKVLYRYKFNAKTSETRG